MWEPKECCCCISRKAGSLVIGILCVIGSCISLLKIIHALLVVDLSAVLHHACGKYQEMPPADCEDLGMKIITGIIVVSVIVEVIRLSFSSMLIHGIRKELPHLMVPFMIMQLIGIILSIVISVIALIMVIVVNANEKIDVYLNGGIVFAFVLLFGLLIFLATYFLLVIRAHYYEVKRGLGLIHGVLVEDPVTENPMAPYFETECVKKCPY